jgi:multicomponent Na+:H+ antiporter subunit B
MIDNIVDITLLSLIAIHAIAIIRMRSLFAVVMLFGGFSFLSAGLFVAMDAADVAFTEAAVGAGISTVLMLATLALTYAPEEADKEEKASTHKPWLPLSVVLITGALLIYGTYDLPAFGDPNAPSQLHVAPYYLEKSLPETGVPNVVTAVLASYRGFDTLGEVTVIFTAGIAVLLVIGGRRRVKPQVEKRDSNREA